MIYLCYIFKNAVEAVSQLRMEAQWLKISRYLLTYLFSHFMVNPFTSREAKYSPRCLTQERKS